MEAPNSVNANISHSKQKYGQAHMCSRLNSLFWGNARHTKVGEKVTPPFCAPLKKITFASMQYFINNILQRTAPIFTAYALIVSFSFCKSYLYRSFRLFSTYQLIDACMHQYHDILIYEGQKRQHHVPLLLYLFNQYLIKREIKLKLEVMGLKTWYQQNQIHKIILILIITRKIHKNETTFYIYLRAKTSFSVYKTLVTDGAGESENVESSSIW